MRTAEHRVGDNPAQGAGVPKLRSSSDGPADGTGRAGAAPAEANSAATDTRSIYRLSPWVDGTVTGAATLAIAVPYALSSKRIKPRCPSDPAKVNALDRGTIGNHSDFADALSTATVGVVSPGQAILDRRNQEPGLMN